jgi:hypothetical protein
VGSRKEFTCQDIEPNHTYVLKQCDIRSTTKNKTAERRIILWNLPHKVNRIESQFIEEVDDGLAISLPLVEFMRNFELIDSSHVQNNFSSYFYRLKCEPGTPVLFTF